MALTVVPGSSTLTIRCKIPDGPTISLTGRATNANITRYEDGDYSSAGILTVKPKSVLPKTTTIELSVDMDVSQLFEMLNQLIATGVVQATFADAPPELKGMKATMIPGQAKMKLKSTRGKAERPRRIIREIEPGGTDGEG